MLPSSLALSSLALNRLDLPGLEDVSVAPVNIGAGAIVGAGSVVTGDVEPGALALARGRRNSAEFNYWPGFVDALSTLVLAVVFLLSVFLVVQFAYF